MLLEYIWKEKKGRNEEKKRGRGQTAHQGTAYCQLYCTHCTSDHVHTPVPVLELNRATGCEGPAQICEPRRADVTPWQRLLSPFPFPLHLDLDLQW